MYSHLFSFKTFQMVLTDYYKFGLIKKYVIYRYNYFCRKYIKCIYYITRTQYLYTNCQISAVWAYLGGGAWIHPTFILLYLFSVKKIN